MSLQYMRECSMALRALHARVRARVAKQLDHGKHRGRTLARLHQDISARDGVRIRPALEQLTGERKEGFIGNTVEIAVDNIPEQRVARAI